MFKMLCQHCKLTTTLSDAESVVGLAHDVDALARLGGELVGGDEYAVALVGTASYASAQLMELRESEALRVEYHHHGGVGHVHAHLDDGGCDENLRLARYELLHLGVFLLRLHLAVHLAYLDRNAHTAHTRHDHLRRPRREHNRRASARSQARADHTQVRQSDDIALRRHTPADTTRASGLHRLSAHHREREERPQVACYVGYLQVEGNAALLRAFEVAWSAQLEVGLSDAESVVGLAHDVDALARLRLIRRRVCRLVFLLYSCKENVKLRTKTVNAECMM